MRISYHRDTDSLYIHLSEAATLESEEVAPDTVVHFGEEGAVAGLEIYSGASEKVDGIPIPEDDVRGEGLNVDSDAFDVIPVYSKGVLGPVSYTMVPKR